MVSAVRVDLADASPLAMRTADQAGGPSQSPLSILEKSVRDLATHVTLVHRRQAEIQFTI
jgi:hypothetical protein